MVARFMPEAGVRELKSRATRILREVRDRRARYVITYRGKPVALLAPLDTTAQASPDARAGEVWEELLRLGDEIARGWRSPQTTVELLSTMRR